MSNRKMQNIQRQQTILLLLALDGKVFSKTLKQRFNVSDNIICNDMIYLEKAGLLKRIEAGAIAVEKCLETDEK
ncbi:DeoR-like helix-turn-helix domain-containing protein [Marinomonas polaris DSM 16579]|uniref:DeoR-like helix-turn-helix domain-containing protein n=1 Tax=Marinomonas polaris DSM 16579 TaxID=1122206 RepID=A0A1M5BY72_9GAMM|nr:DeoR family transcriptional regulator [Marinomonas polaris]SHF47483.1 DeoR-like helix-turn-helix domain-containing protein [Marinomonas polaris DSM 16579]